MKAVALFSGGLDSSLAIKVIFDQGVEVIALNFFSPFCLCDRLKGCASTIKTMADQLKVDCTVIPLGEDYFKMVKNPKHGYGRNLNPCIDCRIFKFKQAKKFMKEQGASFLISGEVLGQRPMSQYRQALKTIEREAELEGLILRPLSAKLLEPTIAEEKGWVNREKLLEISGRSRKPQISLASSLGIKDYPCPAGGCLLTDKTFTPRLKDLFQSGAASLNDVKLLRLGRHFRISPEFKLVVGRNEQENIRILNLAQPGDICFEPEELAGPTALGRGIADEEIKLEAAKIVAHYTSLNEEVKVQMKAYPPNGRKSFIVRKIDDQKLENFKL